MNYVIPRDYDDGGCVAIMFSFQAGRFLGFTFWYHFDLVVFFNYHLLKYIFDNDFKLWTMVEPPWVHRTTVKGSTVVILDSHQQVDYLTVLYMAWVTPSVDETHASSWMAAYVATQLI